MAASATERAHLRFALAVHRAVAGRSGDSCYSPYSVASALGLVATAGRGATGDEVATLLAGSADGVPEQARLLREAAALPGASEGQDGAVLAVSNTLWAWEELRIAHEFTGELARWPGGTLATAPFVSDPEAARGMINADVAKATRDLIPELLSPGDVADDTVASLVNALYLRAGWLFPFREDDTAPADFHPPSGTRRVPMMRQSEQLGYAAGHGWRLVSLAAEGDVEAVALLPEGELADQESTLDADLLRELLSARRTTQVDLAMPRFSLDVRSELTRALRSLGVETMFTRAADFGALTEDARMFVSGVLHQAVLRVGESGLEGAAATAAMMRLVSMPAGEPVTVELDRPFLFLVRHRGTGAVYFLARIVEP
ncbi:serpin B [Prauserella shujinwangii]|uniref:Serpin B n=1 Tax=Prauserella shujinwangii TaxID=1453103 RepID=A0A2T0LTN8_9PSEU|nr:serpin family protein [Prauserella shujinwangii]PRX47085.1 serpin B [Prauserella shujinwangii]